MGTWQRLKLLLKLNLLYFKAVFGLKIPLLTTKTRGNWNIAPEAIRHLSFEFQLVKFKASVNGRHENIGIWLDDVIGIEFLERGGDGYGW